MAWSWDCAMVVTVKHAACRQLYVMISVAAATHSVFHPLLRVIGIANPEQAGGLRPLLELLGSRNGNLQHNAAFALYGLAENEDNIADIVRDGGVQRLQSVDLVVQVQKEIGRS